MRDIYPKEEFSRMMSFVMLVTTIAPLMAPIVGGWVLVWLSWHYIFWILAVAAILASAMIFFLIKETLPPERRQPFHIRTTIGNFAALMPPASRVASRSRNVSRSSACTGICLSSSCAWQNVP